MKDQLKQLIRASKKIRTLVRLSKIDWTYDGVLAFGGDDYRVFIDKQGKCKSDDLHISVRFYIKGKPWYNDPTKYYQEYISFMFDTRHTWDYEPKITISDLIYMEEESINDVIKKIPDIIKTVEEKLDLLKSSEGKRESLQVKLKKAQDALDYSFKAVDICSYYNKSLKI